MADELQIPAQDASNFPAVGERSNRVAVIKAGRQIRDSASLKPWMMAYAEWLILECLEWPKSSLRLSRARGLARAPVGRSALQLLEKREDFQKYCDELRKGPLEQARAAFIASFPTYINAHREGLDMAMESGDVAAIARLTEPVLDRVFPKKAEALQATQIRITLAPTQIAGTTTYRAPELAVEDAVVTEVTPE